MELSNTDTMINDTIINNGLSIEKYDNPYIQVIWEDSSENFTQEKIKSVRHYFQKKYNSTNINIITKSKVNDNVTHNVDISFNILDNNYQIELVKSFLKTKSNEDLFDEILKLNSVVDNKILVTQSEVTPFKKWYIKNIEFSNFLSYGENQKLDFDKCNGISVVESSPSNFGGKCIRYDTNIEVDFNVDLIVNKLGFLPDELK